MYTPKPIDTSAVVLPEGVMPLVEQLAGSNHDQWATLRFSQGWTYGPKRDDAAKQHPCLVPYAELPEAEKEYDRRTAMESIKAVVALGFRIEK